MTEELIKAKHDTTRANIYIKFTELLYLEKPDTVIPLCLKAISICDKNIPTANKKEKRSYLKIKGSAFNNIGYINEKFGKITAALEHYHKGMAIQEEIGDKQGLAQTLNNIGFIYQVEKNGLRAMEYYEKSLVIRESINDKRGIGETFNNLGFLYRTLGDPNCKSLIKGVCNKAGLDKALEFYLKSLKIKKEIKDTVGIGISLNNIGTVYQVLNDLDKSLEYFNESVKIRIRLKDKNGEAIVLNNIGGIYMAKKDYVKAEKYCREAFTLAKEIGFPETIERTTSLLWRIYFKMNDHKRSLEVYRINIKMKDSVDDQIVRKAAEKREFQYQYEKKFTADSLKISEERKIISIERKHEQTQRYVLAGGLLVVIIFALFMFNRFKITQKQKQIIELQKRTVEEKQKEVMDSIHYAKRIQTALLPHEKYIHRNLGRLNKN